MAKAKAKLGDVPPDEASTQTTAPDNGEAEEPTPIDDKTLTQALARLRDSIGRNEYVQACERVDELHALCGGMDIPTALAGVQATALGADAKGLLTRLVRQLPSTTYQFSGNVRAAKVDETAVPGTLATIDDLLELLG